MKTGKRNLKRKPQEIKQGADNNPQGSPTPPKRARSRYRSYTNILSLAPSERKFYGAGIPGVDLQGLFVFRFRGRVEAVEAALALAARITRRDHLMDKGIILVNTAISIAFR